jgi:hypothetical protein
MFKNAKETTTPKREQRERYAADEQRRIASVLGPKPPKHKLLQFWKKEQADKRK